MCPLINTPTPRGGDNHPTENIVSGGVVFDVDHDFEGPRAPKAHLDTVLTKPVTPPGQALYLSPDATHNETRFAPLATERGAEGRTEGQLLQLGALRTEGMNGELGRRLDGVCRAARAHLGRVRARVRARARVRVRVRVREEAAPPVHSSRSFSMRSKVSFWARLSGIVQSAAGHSCGYPTHLRTSRAACGGGVGAGWGVWGRGPVVARSGAITTRRRGRACRTQR